ncbi:unnamed protein product [Withania somnifera]
MTANIQKFRTLSTAVYHSFKMALASLSPPPPCLDDDENELLNRQRLTSSRREALSLYQDIIRATWFFMWANSLGNLWRDELREKVRKEFEEARFERDPEVIIGLLIGGRDALQSALDKLAEKQKQEIEKQRGNSNTP